MNTSALLELQLKQHKNCALLIGSANYPYKSVFNSRMYPFDLNAAEYIVGNRLFPGCDILDSIENRGVSLSQKFLHLDNNYKSLLCLYSGTQANQVVYNAILNPGDKVLVFGEKSGGHPSHISFLEKYYQVIEYQFNFNEGISYNNIATLLEIHKPKLLIAGSTLYPESIDYSLLKNLCENSKTLLLADISHSALYVSTMLHHPVNAYADFISYTTHKTTRGIRSAVLHYKKEYENEILRSLCSITQGAPKYSDILANTIMFEELMKDDLITYQSQIVNCTKLFISIAKQFGFETIGSGNSHMALINLDKIHADLKYIRVLLERNNIYATNHGKYLRIGCMALATLKISKQDLIEIYEILFTILSKSSESEANYANDIKNVMNKYTIDFYKENYNL